jgi:hypothetical protein
VRSRTDIGVGQPFLHGLPLFAKTVFIKIKMPFKIKLSNTPLCMPLLNCNVTINKSVQTVRLICFGTYRATGIKVIYIERRLHRKKPKRRIYLSAIWSKKTDKNVHHGKEHKEQIIWNLFLDVTCYCVQECSKIMRLLVWDVWK